MNGAATRRPGTRAQRRSDPGGRRRSYGRRLRDDIRRQPPCAVPVAPPAATRPGRPRHRRPDHERHARSRQPRRAGDTASRRRSAAGPPRPRPPGGHGSPARVHGLQAVRGADRASAGHTPTPSPGESRSSPTTRDRCSGRGSPGTCRCRGGSRGRCWGRRCWPGRWAEQVASSTAVPSLETRWQTWHGAPRRPTGHTYAALRRARLTWPQPSELARRDDLARALWTESATLVALPQ
jgi:hypothetical protein